MLHEREGISQVAVLIFKLGHQNQSIKLCSFDHSLSQCIMLELGERNKNFSSMRAITNHKHLEDLPPFKRRLCSTKWLTGGHYVPRRPQWASRCCKKKWLHIMSVGACCKCLKGNSYFLFYTIPSFLDQWYNISGSLCVPSSFCINLFLIIGISFSFKEVHPAYDTTESIVC